MSTVYNARMGGGYDLNENQARAVIHKDGPMMVLAGPGSGKTAVITHRALHLAKGHGVNPAEILVITYSKAAATQMRRRYVEQGGSDSAVFGTFHAVFFRMLRAGGGLPADQVISEEERRTEIKKALASFGYDMEDEFVGSVLNELSLVRNELYDMRHYHAASIGTDDFRALSESYEKFKRENGRFDFDDMLTRCHEMLSSDKDALKKWRARFRYMMIDEFQDINRVQYECVKLLAAPENNLFIVGDDDQSIYRFRGARPEFLLNFRSDYADTAEAVLDLNYRSTDKIIACANGIIEKNRIRYGKKIIGTGRDGPKVAKLIHDDQNAEAAYIAQSIKKRSSKGIGYGETAVIYRINMQARAFVEAFLHANVPFNVRDGAPTIYEHWIARDFFSFLRLGVGVPREYDADAERVINKPYRFISKAFMLSMKKKNVSPLIGYVRDPALNELQKMRVEELIFYLKAIGKRKTVDAIKYIRNAAGYDQHIRDHCEFRRLDPAGLYEIADELQEASKQFPDFWDFIKNAEDVIQNAKQSKAPDGQSVTLTTMHSAKGLEFDTVFIAGAVEGVIPHERSKTEAEIEEERRLMYVGVTRAKNALCVSTLRTRYDRQTKPSRFIESI